MSQIQNVVTTPQTVAIEQKKQNLPVKTNFKAGNDQFVRQSSPSQEQMMMRMLQDKQKEQEKAKKKQKWSNALQIGALIAIIASAGFAIWSGLGMRGGKEDKLIQSLKAEIQSIKDVGIKREAEEELARQPYERSIHRIRDLIHLDKLSQTAEKRTPADISKVVKYMDNEVIGMNEAKQPIYDFLESINYDIRNGLDSGKPVILAIDGPPGTGKTTLMKTIADSLGMFFKKISLGGTKNIESITGFERTYAGATPGLIAKAQLEGNTKKVVYGLDELEKTSENILNVLLPILDDQKIFTDRYYNSNIDLSQSIFVVTTNQLENLKGSPIYDRLISHVIRIKPYNIETKAKIAEQKLTKSLNNTKLTDKVELIGDIYTKIAEHTQRLNDQGGRVTTQYVEKIVDALKKADNYNKTGNKIKLDSNFVDDVLGKLENVPI